MLNQIWPKEDFILGNNKSFSSTRAKEKQRFVDNIPQAVKDSWQPRMRTLH